jgi:hypothetical protein
MSLAIGLVLALASAAALNWGYFAQHQASNTLPELSMRRPVQSLMTLFTSGRWLLGYGVGVVGWGLYLGALFLAPISIVQAVSAGGIGLLALFVWRVARVPFSGREKRAIAASMVGLALLALSFFAGVPKTRTVMPATAYMWVGATVVVAVIAWQPGSRLLRPGAGLGAAGGLLFAAGDLATKAAVGGGGIAFVPLLVACLVVGFVALQLAFQLGTALATAGLSTLLNNALPIVGGILAFHEKLPGGVFGVARAVGFVTVVLAAALLARPEREAAGDDPADS